MRQVQCTLSSKDVTHLAVVWLVRALGWTGSTVLIHLLVRAAAEMRSLSAIVQEADAVGCYETVRQDLLALLPSDPLALLPATTRALHSRLPRSLRRRPRLMAIDWHLRPYYGERRTRGVYRAQRKAGTKTFFAYATLLVIRRGQTFTVGLTPIRNGEEQTAIIERLLRQAAQAGLQARRLLLDRGFYGATTIGWLQEHSIPFIMPVVRRGRQGTTKSKCTGTAQFFVSRRRGWDKYTWTARPVRGGRKQPAITVTVDICMAPRPQGKRGKKKGPLVYACHATNWLPRQVMACYKKRFRIETSYRQLGEGLAMTCSKNPTFRLLLVTIALMLRNLWVWLHWKLLAEITPEGRRLRLSRLPLRRLTRWLIRRLDRLLLIGASEVTS